MGIIYKLTFPNGKAYIGQTKRDLETRFKEHIYEAKHKEGNQCTVLNAAINKYGAESIIKEVLDEYPDSELDEQEQLWICIECTNYPYGYNLTSGGQNGKELAEEVRDRMSALQRQYTCEYELPRHVFYICNEEREGFMIRFPNQKKTISLPLTISLWKKNIKRL
jgi:group I intron endonuclease